MASYRDYLDIVATQCSIKPRDPCMRFSQWLGTRTLNGVSQARVVVRCWAEAKVEASITSGLVGRLHNPYALSSKARATLPGEVELIDDDGAVAGGGVMLAVALVLFISAILLVDSVIEMYERVRVARLVHRHASPHPTRRAPTNFTARGPGVTLSANARPPKGP